MSRNGEKFEIFSKFLAHPVETPWPIWTVLHQNVSVISPILKKPTLDKDELSNYRPISNLSLISTRTQLVLRWPTGT